uniref:Phosphate:H symporter (Phosphate:H symporter, variant) n=1 Tax=Ganoderma boninense TaxID=34458 RepID=A0A5K1JVK0_9APHY|nr:Phosphate:H symporter (Phosphate:H symporter, variant) [Ganoderma boninense]
MEDIHASRASTKVLASSDLLHCIINFLPLVWESEESDFLRCALVCRAFYDPAIRLLWRTLGTLLPLWHLLAPPDAPSPLAWGDSRLDYLSKVSAAQSYPVFSEVNDIHLQLLRSVVIKNGGNAVLPLLRSITWPRDAAAVLRDSSLSTLFGPTLRYATIYLEGTDNLANATSLLRLRKSSPFLEFITLTIDYDIGVDLSLARELAAFDRLREMRLPSLAEPQVLQELLARPNLVALSLFEVAGPWVGPPHGVAVHHLLELDVCSHIPSLIGLFGHTRFEVLRVARLSCVRSATHYRLTDMIPVLEAVRGAISPGSLQSLTISSGWFNSSEGKLPLRNVLAPVLSFPGIRSFDLFCPVDLLRHDDEDIDALARAWPQLERLSLYSGILIDPAVSILALHNLYTRCPGLQQLFLSRVRCPAIGVHAIPGPQLDHVPAHPLRKLFIGEIVFPPAVEEGTSEGLLRYFLDLFPCLEDRAVETRSGPLRIAITS